VAKDEQNDLPDVDFADNDEMGAATEEAAVSDIKAEGTGAYLRLFKSKCRICPYRGTEKEALRKTCGSR